PVSVTVSNNTPPVVVIDYPGEGDVLSGTVLLTATATDPDGILGVAFFYDGTHIGTDDDPAEGWSVAWDTTTKLDGAYVLTAQARDGRGLDGESAPVNVTIDNNTPPVISITAPMDGETASATTTITAIASDGGTVTQVEFFIDGASIGAGTLSGGVWTRDWDTTAHADGVHTLLARATDDGGKTGEHSIQVTVDNNVPPTVQIDSPANGATVSATITIEASASDTGDDGGVVQVEFFVDGVSIGVDDSALGGWTTS